MPGHKRTTGRRKGTRNKHTLDVKTAMLAAGADLGGEEGLIGLFKKAGKKDPLVLAGWIAGLVPRQQAVKVDEAGKAVQTSAMTINIVGVPSGHHLSKEECEQAMRDQLPPLLEHESLVIDNDDDDEPS